MRHVIVGNSAAAIGCVEGLRRYDKDSPIRSFSTNPITRTRAR